MRITDESTARVLEFFREYMRVNPKSTDDTVVYQINNRTLKVGDFNGFFKSCELCRYNVYIQDSPCADCSLSYSEFVIDVKGEI